MKENGVNKWCRKQRDVKERSELLEKTWLIHYAFSEQYSTSVIIYTGFSVILRNGKENCRVSAGTKGLREMGRKSQVQERPLDDKGRDGVNRFAY